MIQRSIQASWQLRVFFTEDVFAPDNLTLRDALADAAPRKALVMLKDSLAQALPQLEHQIEKYFPPPRETNPAGSLALFISGGERAKNSSTLVGELHTQIHRHHLDRHSYLIAVGGGALLDVVYSRNIGLLDEKSAARILNLLEKLGLRMLMDVISLDATLVKGSHVRWPADTQDWPVFITEQSELRGAKQIESTDVFQILLRHI